MIIRIASISLRKALSLTFATFLLLFLSSEVSVAQVNLELTNTGPTSSRLTGTGFRVRFQYRCASTNQNANQARLEVSIPSALEFIATENSPHIQASGYDAGTQTAWFDFVDPLPAGTTGEVAVRIRFPNGVTPNGTTANVSGTFSAQGVTSVSSSRTVTAAAISRLTAKKYTLGRPAVGNETVYGITVCNGENSVEELGTLDLGTITVEDQLPASATFVNFNYATSGILSANYDVGTHTATWSLEGLSSGECRWIRFVVRYDAPANVAGQTVTNSVAVTSTPLGESPETVVEDVTHELNISSSLTKIDKKVNASSRYPGGYSSYQINVRNRGTEPLTDLMLTDVIPYETEIFRVTIGEYADATAADNEFVTFQYKTNLNSTWQTYAASPMIAWDGREIETHELGLAFGGPEYLTEIRFQYGDRSNVFESYKDIVLDYRVRAGTPAGTITNCVTTSSTTPGATLDSDCVNFNVLTPLTGASVYINLERESGYGNPFAVGDEIEYVSYINNQSISGSDMDNFMAVVLFPKGTEYIPGSVVINRQDNLVGAPVLEYVENYDGNDNSILRIKWTGANGTLLRDQLVNFNFRAKVTSDVVAGTDAAEFKVYASSTSTIQSCHSSSETDVNDVDGDSDVSEDICHAASTINVSEYVAISSELSVKGSLDSDYTTFPDEGETLPGGLADYRLTVVNQGNVNLSNFTFLDIFPEVGDVGIIDPQARNSTWRPNLVGPVDAPSGVVVYYSTASNPCRAADGFLDTDPVGCEAPNWTIVPPLDITSVSSIKVEFGSQLIAPNDTLVFEWPMRTPTDVLLQPGVNAGDLAFNSVGFIATVDGSGTSLLPSEPVKTGLSIMTLVPGVIGDRVWNDADADGVQDVGEVGINNVRVELYQDDGDGIANVENDTYLGFTSTAGDGTYLFPNLSSGDYFVFMYEPPTFTLASANQGGDSALDSDGISYSGGGKSGVITDVISVTDSDFEFTIDVGFAPSGLGAIGDYVWNDLNADGVQDEGVAAGINGVTVNLLSSGGAVLATAVTSPDEFGKPGYFVFDDITPGSYRLSMDIPSSTTMSVKGAGSDSDADSDGDPSNSGRTDLLAVVANTYLDNVDFALQLSGVEDCTNGIDDDGDGFVDCSDEECPNPNSVVRILLE